MIAIPKPSSERVLFSLLVGFFVASIGLMVLMLAFLAVKYVHDGIAYLMATVPFWGWYLVASIVGISYSYFIFPLEESK